MNRPYAMIDVETTRIKGGERPRTKFWGFYDGKQYRRFETTKQFFKFLRQSPPMALMHHANFDIVQMLVDGEDLKILRSHDGRLIRCQIGEHITINTYSCFPVRLENILKAYGYKKVSLSNLAKRNYGDCVDGYDAVLRLDAEFVAICGVSPLERGTIASTGFHAAEKFAGKMPKDLRFLEAYRGGRVEVYDTRTIHCSKYDINSSYPASILLCPHKSVLLKLKVKCGDWFCPFYDAKNSDMLLFPNGEFTTWIYQDVFERYIQPNMRNTRVKVLSRHPIDFTWLNGLKPMMKDVYELKNKSEGGRKEAAKFLLNSTYGRMGLRGESERARVFNFPVDGDDIRCDYLGKNRWMVFDKVERECRSNFPYAAYITDNARGRLYEAFVKNEAIYGDTDSLFSRAGKNRFQGRIGNDCGEWKFEHRETLEARNIKDYTFGDEEVRKGGSHFVLWSMKQYASGEPARDVTRERRTGLRKREVMPDGSTNPLKIS
jgi:hypothetical protein